MSVNSVNALRPVRTMKHLIARSHALLDEVDGKELKLSLMRRRIAKIVTMNRRCQSPVHHTFKRLSEKLYGSYVKGAISILDSDGQPVDGSAINDVCLIDGNKLKFHDNVLRIVRPSPWVLNVTVGQLLMAGIPFSPRFLMNKSTACFSAEYFVSDKQMTLEQVSKHLPENFTASNVPRALELASCQKLSTYDSPVIVGFSLDAMETDNSPESANRTCFHWFYLDDSCVGKFLTIVVWPFLAKERERLTCALTFLDKPVLAKPEFVFDSRLKETRDAVDTRQGCVLTAFNQTPPPPSLWKSLE